MRRGRSAGMAVACGLVIGCASARGAGGKDVAHPEAEGRVQIAGPAGGRASTGQPSVCVRRVREGLREHRAGRSREAEAVFAAAAKEDPACAAAYLDLAILQRARGARDEARRNLRRALAIDARLLSAFNELALLYLAEAESDRQLDLAEVVCSQAQKIAADFAPIYNTWGLIDLRRDRITDAAAKFRRAFELDPSMYAAYMNFGRVALSFRGYADAREAFEHALALRPKSFDAVIGLGVALRGLGQLEAAEARYGEALALEPSRPEPDYNLGILYQDFRGGSAQDMQHARACFDRFVEKARGRPDYDEAVAEVTRRCAEGDRARTRRRDRCNVGRLQTIEQYLRALAEPGASQ